MKWKKKFKGAQHQIKSNFFFWLPLTANFRKLELIKYRLNFHLKRVGVEAKKKQKLSLRHRSFSSSGDLLKSNKFYWTYRTQELKTREKCWWRKNEEEQEENISISFFKQAQWHSDGRACDKLCFYERSEKGEKTSLICLMWVPSLRLGGKVANVTAQSVEMFIKAWKLWKSFSIFRSIRLAKVRKAIKLCLPFCQLLVTK